MIVYTLTWKHVALELVVLVLTLYLCAAGVSLGWFLLGLRGKWMFAFGLLVVVPIALIPKFALNLATPHIFQPKRDLTGRVKLRKLEKGQRSDRRNDERYALDA